MNKTPCRRCDHAVEPDIERCPECGVSWPGDPFLDRTLRGKIKLDELLGSGIMGQVYKGVETELGRPITVQILSAQDLSPNANLDPKDKRLAEFFISEAETLSKLRHPNLISVLDFGEEDDGLLFLMMEYVPGQELGDILKTHAPLVVPRALHIMLQMLSALEVVHNNQITHRDLKPSTIILEDIAGTEDFVKILDSGIARLVESARNIIDPNARNNAMEQSGTARYMSPEQAMNLELDPRCDIYSAGVILYEMITGTLPHASDNRMDLLVRRISEDAIPPNKLKPELAIPPSVSNICMRALARDREQRYAKIGEFREALEQEMAHMRVDFAAQRASHDLAWAVNQSLQSGIRLALASPSGLPSEGNESVVESPGTLDLERNTHDASSPDGDSSQPHRPPSLSNQATARVHVMVPLPQTSSLTGPSQQPVPLPSQLSDVLSRPPTLGSGRSHVPRTRQPWDETAPSGEASITQDISIHEDNDITGIPEAIAALPEPTPPLEAFTVPKPTYSIEKLVGLPIPDEDEDKEVLAALDALPELESVFDAFAAAPPEHDPLLDDINSLLEGGSVPFEEIEEVLGGLDDAPLTPNPNVEHDINHPRVAMSQPGGFSADGPVPRYAQDLSSLAPFISKPPPMRDVLILSEADAVAETSPAKKSAAITGFEMLIDPALDQHLQVEYPSELELSQNPLESSDDSGFDLFNEQPEAPEPFLLQDFELDRGTPSSEGAELAVEAESLLNVADVDSIRRALSSIPTMTAGVQGRKMAVAAVRLRLGQAAADRKTGILLKNLWHELVKSVELSGTSTLLLGPGLGLLCSEGSMADLAQECVRLRRVVSSRFPFARFGFAVGYGSVKLPENVSEAASSDNFVLGSAADAAIQNAARAQGNQILVNKRDGSRLEERFATAETDSCYILLHSASECVRQADGSWPDPAMMAAQHAGVVGREHERNYVWEVLQKIQAGEPGAPLLITGMEGVGKSTFLTFVRTLAGLIGIPVLETYAHNRLLDRPFRPLLDLVSQAVGEPTFHNLDQMHRGLAMMGLEEGDIGALRNQFVCGTNLERSSGTALGVEINTPLTYLEMCGALNQFNPEDRRRVLTASFGTLLRRIIAPGGAVVIVDDIHQSDASSVKVMPSLCALSCERPILLICTSMTDHLPDLQEFDPMPFLPLSGDEKRRFWEGIGGGDLAKPLERTALERSGGLPFYIALWNETSLTQAPDSIEQLLAEQFRGFPGHVQRLLLVSSTLGEYFEDGELEGLFPEASHLHAALEDARVEGVLQRCVARPLLWKFRNPLLRRIVYHSIPRNERSRYHQSIHNNLRDRSDVTDRYRLLMATHADRAKMQIESMNAAEVLGDHFAVAGDLRVGEYWYFRGLEAAQRVVRDGGSLEHEPLAEFLLKSAEAALRSGHISQASRLLRQLQPQTLEQQMYTVLLHARIHMSTGNLKQAAELVSDDQLLELGRSPTLLLFYHIQAQILIADNQPQEALGILYKGLELIRRVRDDIPPELAHVEWITFTLYSEISIKLGDTEIGEKILMTCFRRALEHGDGIGVTRLLESLGGYFLAQERAAELVDVCTLILSASHLALRITQKARVFRWLARALAKAHDTRQAFRYFEESLELGRLMGWDSFVLKTAEEQEAIRNA